MESTIVSSIVEASFIPIKRPIPFVRNKKGQP
jgi:hypothetical protein